MLSGAQAIRAAGCFVAVLSVSAQGATPTFSVEAVALNATPIQAGPVGRLAVVPGDVVSMEIYVRDWSPEGQRLGAYQTQMDAQSYNSGDAGYVEPVNYEASQESGEGNEANVSLDDAHPRFVHAGLKTLPLVDSRSEGYRWTSILLVPNGPICAQDGRKHYCGGLRLEVSDNARGTFRVGLLTDVGSSGLRDAQAKPIIPTNFEPLELVVFPDLVALVEGLNGATDIPDHQVDLDRDGKRAAADVLRAIDEVTGTG